MQPHAAKWAYGRARRAAPCRAALRRAALRRAVLCRAAPRRAVPCRARVRVRTCVCVSARACTRTCVCVRECVHLFDMTTTAELGVWDSSRVHTHMCLRGDDESGMVSRTRKVPVGRIHVRGELQYRTEGDIESLYALMHTM